MTGFDPGSAALEDCLVGLVDKASASRAEDPRFESRLPHGDFSVLSRTSI